MYERKSRLFARQQSRFIEHFFAGTTACAAAELIDVQANTAVRFYQRLQQLIASKLPSYELSREAEADESYFGGVRKVKEAEELVGKQWYLVC
jgi:transposase